MAFPLVAPMSATVLSPCNLPGLAGLASRDLSWRNRFGLAPWPALGWMVLPGFLGQISRCHGEDVNKYAETIDVLLSHWLVDFHKKWLITTYNKPFSATVMRIDISTRPLYICFLPKGLGNHWNSANKYQ